MLILSMASTLHLSVIFSNKNVLLFAFKLNYRHVNPVYGLQPPFIPNLFYKNVLLFVCNLNYRQ